MTLQWVAAALILLVVGLGLYDHARKHTNNASGTTTTTTLATTTTTGVPTTTPSVALPVAPTKSATKPAASPTSTSRAAGSGGTGTTAAPTTCSSNDLRFSTTTDQRAYASGQAVNIVTTLIDVNACYFSPEAAGLYNCPVTLTVNNSNPEQVWPARGQGEQCSPPGGGLLQPGSTESLSTTWNGEVVGSNGQLQPAPAGSYTAVGTWGFAGPSGRVIVTPNSAPFTIS